jgi:4-diphosphocytidyl-2-C-methyl-D-erythritol kinase
MHPNGVPIDYIPKTADNTCIKAITEFSKFTDIECNVDIKLVKRIPSGGGLGGGSSDAGGVIKALDTIYHTNLSSDDMLKIAAKVGADVPFFIINKPCRVRGIGDELSLTTSKYKNAIIFMPKRVHCDTKKVYNEYDRLKTQMLEPTVTPAFAENCSPNDLLAPALNVYPKLESVAQLARLVAAKLGNAPYGMSGSGSTFWVICPPELNLYDLILDNNLDIKKYLLEHKIMFQKVDFI